MRLYGALALLLPTASKAELDVWEPIGPYVATVFSYGVHPTDSNTIYVGTFFNGVYKSSDGGLSWVHQDSGFGSAFVPTMVTDLNNPGTFYAGTFERGVFKKTNTSSTWTPVNNGLLPVNIDGLGISSINSNRLIACSFLGPYITADGAASWKSWQQGSLYDLQLLEEVASSSIPTLGRNGGRRIIIASDINNENIIFRFFDNPLDASLFNQTILQESEATALLATLNNADWDINNLSTQEISDILEQSLQLTQHTVTLPCLSALFSRTFESVAYLGTNGNGVYISIDAGNSWTPWNTGMEDVIVFDMKLHPFVEVVYAATNRGVFSRGAADSTWTSLKYNLLDANITQINFLNDGRLVSSSGVGSFVLETQNDTIWDVWYDQPARLVITIPGSSRAIVAGAVDTLALTNDNGATFQSIVSGIQNNFPDSLAAFEAGGETILTAGVERGVWRTPDPFAQLPLGWVNASTIAKHLILELTPHPTRENHIYAGTERAGVWFSDDTGFTWTQRTDGIHPSRIFDIEQAGQGDHTYYSATQVGLYRSDDEGRNWRLATPDALPTLVTAVATDAVKPGFAYYGTASGTLSSTQNNADFFPVTNLGQSIKAIRSVPFEGIYVVLDDGTIMSSRNDTLNLAPRNDGLAHPVLDLQVNLTTTNIAYAGTAGGGVYKTISEGSQWEAANTGMENAFIFSLVIDPNNPERIFATSSGVVYRSENAASTWEQVSTTGLPATISITDITIDPNNSNILYCSVYNQGIFQSVDGGMTWSNTALPNSDSLGALPITHSTTRPGEVLVGSEITGVQRWENISKNWIHSGNGMTDLIRGLVISPTEPNTMFAASLNSGVFKTSDAGDAWTLSGLRGRRCLHLEMNPQNHNEIFVGTTQGLAATFDGGQTWQEMGQRVGFASTLTHLAGDPQSIVIAGSRGLTYQSNNGGNSWMPRNQGLPQNEITTLTKNNQVNFYAGTDRAGVYRSTDSGEQWNLISGNLLNNDKIISIAFEDTFGQLFIATQTSGLFSGGSNGEFLAPITLPRANYTVDNLTEVIIDPFDINTLIVSRSNQSGLDISIHRSTDRGVTWTTPDAASGLAVGSVFAIAASPQVQGQWLCGHDNGVYRSIDGGTTWQPTSGESFTATTIHYDVNNPNRVYAASAEGGLYYSIDSGLTWQLSNMSPTLFVSDISTGVGQPAIIASTFNRGMVVSMDHGMNWTDGISPALAAPSILYVVINPVNPNNIFLATPISILRSNDGGFTFEEVNNGLQGNQSLLSMLMDPKDPDVLYAGTVTGGVYVSSDQGDSWAPMNAGKFHELTIAMAIDPVDHRKIYAGFEGGGVYRMQRSNKYLRANSDHDLDGLPSIWEQYLNLDPLNPDDYSPLHQVTISHDQTTQLHWMKGSTAPAEPVNVHIQWSRDLNNWFNAEKTPGPTPYVTIQELGPEDNFIRMEATVVDPQNEEALFLRLQLSR